jgi:hypothetical protein
VEFKASLLQTFTKPILVYEIKAGFKSFLELGSACYNFPFLIKSSNDALSETYMAILKVLWGKIFLKAKPLVFS